MNVKNNEFLFLPLGGIGKIGMNVNLYHYAGKWIIVDLGIGFADHNMPGVNLLVADLGFIASKKKDLLGIIITHAHEDHCGALPYLWKELQCPVYTTKFTMNFLKEKFKEFRLQDQVPLKEVNINGIITLGPFTIEFIHMTHSIPEAHAILISVTVGSVLHTGDWKFDPKPVVGNVSNITRLKEIGITGDLLAVVCDSTNILSTQKHESEGALYDNIHTIIKNSKKLVAISLFASNVARIKTIVQVAQSLNRQVVLLGRSLCRIVKVAQESGYLSTKFNFLDAKHAKNIPRDQLVLLCTGCQGEPMAATSRLAYHTHQSFKIQPGDTIIFSSKTIPGNETEIRDMLNSFINMGVEVITDKTDYIHASGHPTRVELQKLYSLIKPKISIPIHGEYIHIYKHVQFAKSCGIKQALMLSPGDMINLENGYKSYTTHAGFFGIDGAFLRHPNSNVIKMRKSMRDSGLIVVTVILDKNNVLIAKPILFAPGVFAMREDALILYKIIEKIESICHLHESTGIKHKITNAILVIIREYVLKKPVIHIQIEQL
ncbi:ribonuclease J [Wolbachia endosymbiont of Howardula sp.]|uniref:ribonuclease J n=1 Tax=Wolbachia endosymbiont of Howardula sp. TaxID=2916816 RepID=UPI00217D186B|nr:ribonuclease J [Wolbachia endosymbiont of Howardula sp.]UWI83256.1 ribonuclease J [Wolbachia endosymbiont of Howardula sp.]